MVLFIIIDVIETRTGLEPAFPPFCRRCPRPLIGYLVVLRAGIEPARPLLTTDF